MRISIALFLSLLFLCDCAEAQQSMHHLELISSESGLNDIVVNDVVGDEKGVIWLGTENGLSRYINGKFELYHEYSERVQLVGHTITKLFIDSKGRLWVGDRLQGISVVDINTNISWCFSNSAPNRKLYGKEVLDFKEDSKGNIWALIFPNIITKFSADLNEIHSLDLSGNKEGELNKIESMCLIQDQVYFTSIDKGVSVLDESSGQLKSVDWINSKVGIHGFGNILFVHNSNKLIYKSNTSIYKIDLFNQSVSKVLEGLSPSNKVSICRNDSAQTYIVQFPRVWKLDEDLNLSSSMNIVLPANLHHLQFVQKKCYLNESNILFIGTDQGILKLNVEQQYFKIAQQLKNSQGQTLSGNYLRTLYKLKNGNLLCSYVGESKLDLLEINSNKEENIIRNIRPIEMIASPGTHHRVNGIIETKKGQVYISTYDALWKLDIPNMQALKIKTKPEKFKLVSQSIWSFLELEEGRILLGTRQNGLHFFDAQSGIISEGQILMQGEGSWSQNNSIWQFYTDSRDSVWLITSQGLYKLIDHKNDTIILKHYEALKDYSLWAITESNEGELWLGSIEYGIHCIDPSGKLLAQIDFNSGLNSMSICALVKDDEGRIWASSPLGLSLIDSKSKKVSRYFSSTEELQLLGFNYRSVVKDNYGRLYFGTRMGLLYFEPKEVLKKHKISKSKLVINRINHEVQSLDFKLPELINLDNGIRSIDIEPALIDYLDPEKNSYHYRLVGVEKQWNELKGPLPRIVYLNLQPGNYRLEIKAFDANGIEAANMLAIPVHVVPYFWETTWFMIALIALMALIILYFLRLRWLSTRSEAKLMESQMTSLRAQMNPHFFFNALNSIQDYIFHKDSEKAANYMSGFAKLLRNILDNSSERYISLRDEVQFLNQYLELESLRFEDKMKYSITVGKEIDSDQTKIPNMLIQPIVENSVKHGLAPLQKQMQLDIKFYLLGKHLICEIEDNGIGRNNGLKPKHSHNSKGIRTVEERMSLLSIEKKQKLKLSIEDKKDELGNALGTKVVLKLS